MVPRSGSPPPPPARNRLVVITQPDGNVFGADVVVQSVQPPVASVGPVFQFSGAKIGFNPQDRFMVALDNTLAVITKDGNVFAADVVRRAIGPVFQFSGAKIGFNPQDRFMVAIGKSVTVLNKLGDITAAGRVRRLTRARQRL